MMEKASIISKANTDRNIIEQIGNFVKETRLSQNKTQQDIAAAAGINRTTLVQLEKGESVNLLSLIQVLRALKRLDVLSLMEHKIEISPIKLAEMEQKQRQRASKANDAKGTKKSDW
jgi:transcriptional regulator with XRE-family HTH domain